LPKEKIIVLLTPVSANQIIKRIEFLFCKILFSLPISPVPLDPYDGIVDGNPSIGHGSAE
jgi:hypothetical protein